MEHEQPRAWSFCNNHDVSTRRPRVLVTRSPQQASALADRLRELGAAPVLIPTIETVEPTSFAALDAALADLSAFDWLVFTSANAVESFGARQASGKSGAASDDQSPTPGAFPRTAVIGAATARALTEIGLAPDLVPAQAVSESLTQALLPFARQPDGAPTRFLLVRAEEAREYLPGTLRAAGAEVTIAPAYRTGVPAGATERLREALHADQRVEAVTFTSSSTARNLFALLAAAGCELPPDVVRASIGPITSATLRELGFPAHVEAPEATVESLALALIEHLAVR